MMKILTCNRCGHQWRPHSARRRPVACPKCKSRRFDKPRVYRIEGKPEPETFREPPAPARDG